MWLGHLQQQHPTIFRTVRSSYSHLITGQRENIKWLHQVPHTTWLRTEILLKSKLLLQITELPLVLFVDDFMQNFIFQKNFPFEFGEFAFQHICQPLLSIWTKKSFQFRLSKEMCWFFACCTAHKYLFIFQKLAWAVEFVVPQFSHTDPAFL